VWLQLRTDAAIAVRAKKAATILGPVVLVAFAVAGLWVAFGIEGYRIVSQPPPGAQPNPLGKVVTMATGAWLDIYRTMPVTILAPAAGFAGIALATILSRADRPGLAFVASGTGIAGIIGTAGLSMFPFVMPSSIDPNSSLTVWDATSSPLTLTVMFWAVVVFLPIVLAYTVWSYRRMWGKLTVADIRAHSHSAY
jgi:cytochrome d ubiquinol oxidase subunit II